MSRFDGGVIIVDHRAGPGLPEEMAIQAGYDPKMCVGGKVYESATITCAHCRGVYVKNYFRVRERAHCQKCSGQYICDICYGKSQQPLYSHLPFEQLRDNLLEQAEKELQFGSSLQLLLST